jgi:serine/threonine-protein kinase RsbW
MSFQITRTLDTDFDQLADVEEIVTELSTAAKLNEEQTASLMLAASEATTNAMLHGNKMDESKKVVVIAEVAGDEARYSVEDEGDGFKPDDVPNPLDAENLLKTSGRGVFLMKTYCDDVRFDKGGRRVTLVMTLEN